MCYSFELLSRSSCIIYSLIQYFSRQSREISSKKNRPEIDLVAVPLAGAPLLSADSSSSPCNTDNNIPGMSCLFSLQRV